MSHFPPLADYIIVQDTTPSTGPWSVVAGAIVPWADAGLAVWLPTIANNPAEYGVTLNILDCSSASAGAATSLHVQDTSQFTNGQKWNVSSTTLYDGNQTITALDATHVTIPVAFAGNATGFLAGAAIIQTMAGLLANIDAYNQAKTPPSYLPVSSGVNYSIPTLPLFFDFTPTAGSLALILPKMNVPGSPPMGKQFIIRNASLNTPFLLQHFGGGGVFTGNVPSGSLILLELTDNSTQAGALAANFLFQANEQQIGDASQNLANVAANGLINVYATNAALTAPRTWTLPLAFNCVQGTLALISDEIGGVTSTNTLSIARAGADTINGAVSSIVLNRAHDWVLLQTDGSSKWTIIGGKSSLASTDLSDLPIPVGSGGTGGTKINSSRMYLNVQQAGVVANTWTKVLYDTVDFDPDGIVDTVNHRITPNVSGTFMVVATIYCAFTVIAAGGFTGCRITKNGTFVQIGNFQPVSFVGFDQFILQTVNLVRMNGTTDYVEAEGQLQSSTTGNFNPGIQLTTLQLYRVGP